MVPEVPGEVLRIVERIVAGYRPEQVILFGSYAEGRAGEDSDVDLLVVKDTSEDFYARIRNARRTFRDSGRRLPVDVIVLTPSELDRALEPVWVSRLVSTGISRDHFEGGLALSGVADPGMRFGEDVPLLRP